MKQYDDFLQSVAPLLETLGANERAKTDAELRRLKTAIERLEANTTHLLRERASIHALLIKTSEDLMRRYQTIFENSGTAMAVIEDNGIISMVNSVFEGLSGYRREEIERIRTIFSFVAPEETNRLTSYHAARRNSSSTAPHTYETRVLTRDGREIHVLITVQLFPGTKQSIASILDITERKRAEDALRLAHTKLNILSNLSRHDILNQLTVLSGYLELSQVQTTEPHLREFIKKEAEVTDNITNMVNFTRDYQDIGIKSPAWQDLESAIVRASTGVVFGAVRLHLDVGRVQVWADPLLERVFYNIMENALRYGRTITEIRFSFHAKETEGIIVCEDNGVGVPAKEKENIFLRKYFQHTGLGMFLSREILAITGITITETGEPGKGARFEIAVPKGSWRSVQEE